MTQESANSFEQLFRFRYINLICRGLEVGIAVVIAAELFFAAEPILILVLSALLIAVVIVHALSRSGYQELASTSLFLLLTATISWLMWRYGGIRDEILLAFPALIMFTAFIGSSRISALIVVVSIINVLLLGVLHDLGIRESYVTSKGVEAAFVLSVVLFLTAYSAYVVAKDIRRVFGRLEDEQIRALDSQARIERLVHHDALTNLPNRILARELFDHAMAVAKRNNGCVYLMFLDLDNFKTANDSFGHQSGDKILIEIANRLQHPIRESDTVSRLGGDEFLLILEGIESQERVSEIAEAVLDCIKQPIKLKNSTVSLTGSLGIAVAPHDGEDFDTICKQADMAMYHTKELGRNDYHFFDQNMDESAVRRSLLLAEMRKAIDQTDFELCYQPQIDLRRNQVTGAEALIRWHHAEGGYIDPAEFIPLAEQSGMILDISAWVIREACLACRGWRDAGRSDLTVAVNVSSVEFYRGDIVALVEVALAESGLPATALELELTESLLIKDSPAVRQSLADLRELGVNLSIDDFGTGYSNLSYLRQLKVSKLKIDRSFINRVAYDDLDRELVSAMVQIADSFKLETVAEGVEDVQGAALVTELGCDIGQGFYWSRPCSADNLLWYARSMARASGD